MEESTAPAAPASEATPTTNPAPAEAPQAPAAPAAPTANIPADQIEAFNKFVDSNGGFEKAFAKLRTDVSTPAPQPAQPAQSAQPAQQQMTTEQLEQIINSKPAEQSIPVGYITPEEFTAQQYFYTLANEPEYSAISDQVRSGAVLKEMAKFGIRPMQNGAINDRQIRDFLGLYAKTVPTPAPAAPVTNTPTVDYVNVGEQVTSRDDAMRILEQNSKLKAGVAPHPQTEAAKEFLKGYFNGTKK